MYWKLLVLFMVLSIRCMEPEVQIVIEPRSVSPEIIVRQLSLYIFNRESDVQFEKIFLEIMHNKKNPKLYPELIAMREHIMREMQFRVKG